MKLLIATGVYPPESGGPATYTKLLEEKLPALGYTVRVLPFRVVRHLPKILRHIAYLFKCMSAARGVDIVYAQDPVSVGLPAVLAAKLMGKKFVVRLGGDYAWEQARQRFGVTDELDSFQTKSYGGSVALLRTIQRFVIRRAVAVVVPSEYMKRIVSKWTTASRVHRIYSSIELPPQYAPVERPEGFLILSFGRNVPWKGFEALAHVVAREPRWALKVFHDLPHQEAMGWLKVADVYVNNSTYEGLSHQLVESLALGTPVIATNIGGNPEIVGDAGMLIPANNEEVLYQALKEVSAHPAEARERTARARGRLKEFSIDTTIHDLDRLLKSI